MHVYIKSKFVAMFVSMFLLFIDSQTAEPIAIKFTELKTKTSGFSFKPKKFLKNLINILINLIDS